MYIVYKYCSMKALNKKKNYRSKNMIDFDIVYMFKIRYDL